MKKLLIISVLLVALPHISGMTNTYEITPGWRDAWKVVFNRITPLQLCENKKSKILNKNLKSSDSHHKQEKLRELTTCIDRLKSDAHITSKKRLIKVIVKFAPPAPHAEALPVI